MRSVGLLVFPALMAFLALVGAAMATYPGGTWEDPQAAGHSVFFNYFCDLMRPQGLNGQPNPNASFAEWGLLAFAAALLPFFVAVPLCFPGKPRLGLVTRILGVLASIGGMGIVLVPSHKFGSAAHGAMVLLAAGPGLTAAVLSVIGLSSARAEAKWPFRAAVATLICAALVVGIFARQLALKQETTFGLAFLQKVAMALAMAWMIVTVLHARRLQR